MIALEKLLGSLGRLARELGEEPKWYSLAHTVEDFHMPPDVGGDVADKSTFARLFVSCYNTFFDPGFHGNATLEIVNDSDQRVHLKAGQGVCQFIFTWLDEPTDDPYSGKYQGQTKAAHGPRYEEGDGVAKTPIAGRWITGPTTRTFVPNPPPLSEAEEIARRQASADIQAMIDGKKRRQRELDALRFGRPSAEP